MNTFLHDVISSLYSQNYNLSKLTYVVPSRRVATFLNKTIAAFLEQPIFEPIVYSVEDFISHTAQVEIASDVDLLFDFYNSYLKIEGNNTADSLDEFITWAPTILKDFNEIDRFLVPPSDFFNYLGNLKELEQGHWSILEPKTEMIEKYLHFWKRLELYYSQFTKDCTINGIVYQGLAYRLAFAKAEYQSTQYSKETPIIFLGLNALNKAEEEIIKIFLDSNNAKIFYDSDLYFQENQYHEAGRFIRRYKSHWNYFEQHNLNITSNNFNAPKSINMIGTSGPIGMCQVAGKLINKLNLESINLDTTAIVLADEALLLPLLSAIPESAKHLNITMGLTLDKTPLASFFNQLIKLKVEATDQGFYYKNVIAVLESHFSSLLDQTAVKELMNTIHKENLVYIPFLEANQDTANLYINQLRSEVITTTNLINYLSNISDALQSKLIENENKRLELEQLLGIHSVIEQIRSIIDVQSGITDLRTIQYLFKQFLPQKKLDFIGEPVKGLQVMGLLETRALDYENIIMLSVNEGILPAGKSTASYIPYDMKIKFGLPTYTDKDSVYAYHFYRLLQRCNNANFIYNSETNSLGGGEKSRFLMQLETSGIKNHTINHSLYANKITTEKTDTLSINKDNHYFDRLGKIAISGFSPSSITSYIYNPIDFYKSKILKINDIEEVEEDMAANTMGTMIHKTLESLYLQYIDQVLDRIHFKDIRERLNNAINKAYLDSYNTIHDPQGKNIIMYEVARHYVSKMIAYDEELVKNGNILIIRKLEVRYSTTIEINSIGSVKLHGEVDRIDELNGQIRIIDYKSGMVGKSNVGVEPDNYQALITDYDKSKAFQVLMYAFLYSKNNEFTECVAGIISFKNFKEGFIPYSVKNGRSFQPRPIDVFELEKFEEQLHQIIIELYNKDIALTAKDH
ncbi:PD-(D/E)XK nuclease family protein [Nonlabens ulvanivorans]|uniref:PD-(D/E)XK nuclease family protein n=2 Tax=Nonlabens ulvanivorans TaxID=906888 RepID=UPI0032662DCB